MIKLALLAAFLAVKSIYLPLNRRKSRYYWKLKIDDHIPFLTVFVVPYLSYFIFILLTVVAIWGTVFVYRFFTAYIISYVIGGLFWFFFPNGVKRPEVTGTNIFDRMTTVLFKMDDDTNGFPSAHIFATLICSYYLSLAYGGYSVAIWTTGALISASTIFVKQHYVLDIAGGVAVFFLSVLAASALLPFGKI